jgi:hypothetical protein
MSLDEKVFRQYVNTKIPTLEALSLFLASSTYTVTSLLISRSLSGDGVFPTPPRCVVPERWSGNSILPLPPSFFGCWAVVEKTIQSSFQRFYRQHARSTISSSFWKVSDQQYGGGI